MQSLLKEALLSSINSKGLTFTVSVCERYHAWEKKKKKQKRNKKKRNALFRMGEEKVVVFSVSILKLDYLDLKK